MDQKYVVLRTENDLIISLTNAKLNILEKYEKVKFFDDITEAAVFIDCYNMIIKLSHDSLITFIELGLSELRDSERVDIFSLFCQGCGCTDPKCACQNLKNLVEN
jgi:hypothetical protein